MELKEFIKETMLSIAKGESEASNELSQMGWTTNITSSNAKIDGMPSITAEHLGKSKTAPIVGVGFRVKVEVQESSSVDGGASIRVLSVGGNSSSERTEAHEVSFVLPMAKKADKSR